VYIWLLTSFDGLHLQNASTPTTLNEPWKEGRRRVGEARGPRGMKEKEYV
jgi:hypothetical protein